MARAALGWSLDHLAKSANLSEKTIRRIEAETENHNTTLNTLTAIKSALEAAGIEFIGAPGDRPGIRLRDG